MARLDWRADAAIAHVVEQDAEGDALDAILCGLAAVNASTLDHAVIAGHEGALQEGWIYV